MMTRDEIISNLGGRPEPGKERLRYFEQLYGQIVGWVSDPDKQWLVDFLPEYSLSLKTDPKILEVGTFGGSTARGLVALTGGRITCIDDWRDFHPAGAPDESSKTAKTGPEFFWETLRGYGADLSGQVDAILTGNSQEIGPGWIEPLDVLFVDGDHSYDGASADIGLFSPHVLPGGLLLVDDYDMPEVRRACMDMPEQEWWSVFRVPTQPAKVYAAKKRSRRRYS